MENMDGGIKRKSRLAVFEHVRERQNSPKKKKFRTNRLELDDSSLSESELVIDDEKEHVKAKDRQLLIPLSQEVLHLYCEWDFCNEKFDTWESFNTHLIDHASINSDCPRCQWKDCNTSCETFSLLAQHVSYHGYVTKLKNIGQNVLDRNDWPECNLKENYKIPLCPEGYSCMWEYCFCLLYNIFDFYNHMRIHVENNPRVANKEKNEIIACCWEGCNAKFSTKYKLGEHVRIHTKEKIIACPTCCTMFSNKTKLCDHRKRQLATDLQSYQCSQCLKLFPSERLLRDHMRSHINHYKCTMCDMTCPKPSILTKHIRFKHINFKPYQCSMCPKTFVTKGNLDTHLRGHSSENPMKCDLCDFECRAKIGLDGHYAKTHQKGAAVYECHCCKKRFARGGSLTKHLMRVHNYHWPSGHSRFRYRKDQDGIHRLQTVRYESLEVTQEMIRSESMQANNTAPSVSYNLRYDSDGKSNYILHVSEDGEQSIKKADQEKDNILITIDDLDEEGHIIRTEVIESGDIASTVVKDKIVIDQGSAKEECGTVDPDVQVKVENIKVKSRKRKRAAKHKRKSIPKKKDHRFET